MAFQVSDDGCSADEQVTSIRPQTLELLRANKSGQAGLEIGSDVALYLLLLHVLETVDVFLLKRLDELNQIVLHDW